MKGKPDLLETRILEIGEKEVGEFLKNLRPTIRTRLDQALASLLGITNSWGRTEIDHCNSRNSVLTKAVEEISLAEVRKIVQQKGKLSTYIPFIEKALDAEIKRNLECAIKREVEEQIRPAIKQMIAERLPARVKEAVRIALEKEPNKKIREEQPF